MQLNIDVLRNQEIIHFNNENYTKAIYEY